MFPNRKRVSICGRKDEVICQFAFCLYWLIHLGQNLLNLMFKWLFQQYRRLHIVLLDAADTCPQFPFSFMPGRLAVFVCITYITEGNYFYSFFPVSLMSTVYM